MNRIIILLLVVVMFISCSKSGRRHTNNSKFVVVGSNDRSKFSSGQRTVVKMEKVSGVYQIPIEVNGVRMSFIFDTGASIISISQTEAMFLYKQGKLTADDIKGTANFSDANGDISEGTIVELKSIKIGDRVLNNVEASVVGNLTAPLLFGQSALGEFRKISIDNNRREVTFE